MQELRITVTDNVDMKNDTDPATTPLTAEVDDLDAAKSRITDALGNSPYSQCAYVDASTIPNDLVQIELRGYMVNDAKSTPGGFQALRGGVALVVTAAALDTSLVNDAVVV